MIREEAGIILSEEDAEVVGGPSSCTARPAPEVRMARKESAYACIQAQAMLSQHDPCFSILQSFVQTGITRIAAWRS